MNYFKKIITGNKEKSKIFNIMNIKLLFKIKVDN